MLVTYAKYMQEMAGDNNMCDSIAAGAQISLFIRMPVMRER